MNENEKYVRANWERAEVCETVTGLKWCIALGGRGFNMAYIPDNWAMSEADAWAAAAEFTRERREQIRQLKEERNLLLGMIALLASEPGDLTAPVYQRTVARLESALADLKRGMTVVRNGKLEGEL